MNKVLVETWDEYKIYSYLVIIKIFENTHLLPLKSTENMNSPEGDYLYAIQTGRKKVDFFSPSNGRHQKIHISKKTPLPERYTYLYPKDSQLKISPSKYLNTIWPISPFPHPVYNSREPSTRPQL